ncbi:unnamed protein product [Sympodiomycopsis kandeliae]
MMSPLRTAAAAATRYVQIDLSEWDTAADTTAALPSSEGAAGADLIPEASRCGLAGDEAPMEAKFVQAVRERLSHVEHAHDTLVDAPQHAGKDVGGREPSETQTPSARIAAALDGVDRVEAVARDVNSRVARAYHLLGEAYVEYARRTFDQCPSPSTTAFHRLVFGSALLSLRALHGPVKSSTSGVKKRLERARKFWILVSIFGEPVLLLADQITVSRIDRLSFVSLRRISEMAVSHAVGERDAERISLASSKAPDADTLALRAPVSPSTSTPDLMEISASADALR